MSIEDLSIYGTAWCAFGCYVLAGCLAQRETAAGGVRRVWTAGMILFLLHVLAAFHWRHDWSHARALEDTARQTAEVTGLSRGEGLWLNYLVLLAWLADVVGWNWIRRHPPVHRGLQGFLLFMWFNATVVFGSGPMQLAGTLGFVLWGIAWWNNRRHRANRLHGGHNLD